MKNVKVATLTTDNNQSIVANLFSPKQEMKAVVVIASALGVDSLYYQDFALWLANQGYMVITFDYSSMGSSNTTDYKTSKATIIDWATYDCKAVLSQAVINAKGKDIYWIGHSLGGQITAMIPNIDVVSKVITVASGSGYWRENAAELKKKVWFLWYFLAPVLLKTLGYFPGKRLGMVGNLPHGVMMQWRKWCLHPQYFLGVENQSVRNAYETFNKPITSISFSDDQLMSAENIHSLHSFFGKSKPKMLGFSPEQLDVNSIGHFGFFKAMFKETLWELHLLPELAIES